MFCWLGRCIPFPLAVDAAAVLLAVEVEWFGQVATVRISFAEVGIKKCYSCFFSDAGPDFADEVVLLVGADEQGGGKSAEVLFAGKLRSPGKTHPEAVLATFAFMVDYFVEVIDDFIPFTDSQRDSQLSCQSLYRFQTLLVFRIRVNIRVVPEGTDIIPLFSPVVGGVGGAMRAANVQQY